MVRHFRSHHICQVSPAATNDTAGLSFRLLLYFIAITLTISNHFINNSAIRVKQWTNTVEEITKHAKLCIKRLLSLCDIYCHFKGSSASRGSDQANCVLLEKRP